MLIDFTGQTAVVTGGTGGIGRRIVKVMLESGAKVAVVGSRREALDRTVEELSVYGTIKGYELNLADVDAIAPVIEQVRSDLGEVSVLIQAAAMMGGSPGLDVTQEDWDKAMNINSRGLFFMMQQVVKQSMQNIGGGAIVNVSSMAGIRGMHPPMCSAWYSASKGAVVASTMQAAVEWALLGVRVNAIAPGGVNTRGQTVDQVPPDVIDPVPTRRLTEPEDVAYLAAFLASDKALAITGQTVVIDGGASIVGY